MTTQHLEIELGAHLKTSDVAEMNAELKRLGSDKGVQLTANLGDLRNKLTEAKASLKAYKKLGLTSGTVKLTANIEGLKKQVNIANRSLNNFVATGNTVKSRLGGMFDGIGKSLVSSIKNLVGPMAIVAGFMAAIRGFARELRLAGEAATKFEKSMSNVATLVDTSVESIDDMGQELLNISLRVPKSVGELTEALYDVRSAGISAEDAMSVLESSARLATAGLGTTKEAVNLMTSAINTFSEQGYTAEEIASTFFLAVKNGKTTISELAQGFGSISSLTANLSVDFRDLVAASTALTTSGLSASEAYTQVAGIMTAIAKQTPQSLKAAKAIGFEFSATAIETKGLSGFLDDLSSKLEDNGIEGAKTTEVLSKLFGRKEALVGVLSLLNSRSEAYRDILIEMTGESTAFLEAFDKQAKTVDARLVTLNNELEIQRIKLGSSTSMRRGFGIYLKKEFLSTLNSVISTFKVIGSAVANTGKAIFYGFAESFSGVGKLINQFKDGFKTGKFKISLSDAFDFSKTLSSIKAIGQTTKETFDGSSTAAAEAVKRRNEIIEQLNSDLEKDDKDKSKSSLKSIDEQKEATKEYADAVKDMSKEAGSAYDDLTKKIEKSIKAQEKLKDEIGGIDKDIAARIVEIDEALAGDDLEQPERQLLQSERKQAFQGLSEEEVTVLKAQVTEIAEFEKMTEIGKLQALKDEKKLALEEEIANETQLLKQKVTLQNLFAEFLSDKVDEEMVWAEKLRQKRLAVARARASAGAGGGPISSVAQSSTSTNKSSTSVTVGDVNVDLSTLQAQVEDGEITNIQQLSDIFSVATTAAIAQQIATQIDIDGQTGG